jgi:hypothetical protein
MSPAGDAGKTMKINHEETKESKELDNLRALRFFMADLPRY